MRTKYKNPPINELIIGAYFEPPLAALQSEHLGVFWSQVRNEFPTIRQLPELIGLPIAPHVLQITFEPYPMPRFWLITEDEVMLLQIQKNAFLLNWRKREKEYPHFDAVKAHFDRHLNSFQAFIKAELGIEQLSIQFVELTYTNLLLESPLWQGASDIAKILPGVAVPDPGMPLLQKPDVNYVTAYKLESDLTLNFSVRTAHLDATRAGLIFEFRSVGVLERPDRAAADQWYNRAHEAIGRCFVALTSSDIRRTVWQPE